MWGPVLLRLAFYFWSSLAYLRALFKCVSLSFPSVPCKKNTYEICWDVLKVLASPQELHSDPAYHILNGPIYTLLNCKAALHTNLCLTSLAPASQSFTSIYLLCMCFEFFSGEFRFAFPPLREHSPDHKPPGSFLGYHHPSSIPHDSL